MRPVSDDFLRTVRGSHVMTARARVVERGQTGTNPTGTEIPIVDGDVAYAAKVHGGAHVRGAAITSSLSLATEGNLWPYRTDDLLAPFGNEIYVERGIAYGNGTTEWVGLGYYRIDTVEQENAPDGVIAISATDRSSGIKDARLLAPRQYAASTTLGAVVDDIVLDIYPDAEIVWGTSVNTSTLGRRLVVEEDRFEFLTSLVTSIGMIMYWDYEGKLRIEYAPDSTTPVYDINAGADGVLVEISRDLSREGIYNGVSAEGEAADTAPPVRAARVDNNPDSPTYWFGNFGRVPRFYSSPLIVTKTQAIDAADSILKQSLGMPYNVDLGSVANPALEPLDPVRVIYSLGNRSRGLRTETHILEEITIPLTAQGVMSARTREQTLVKIGEV